VEILINPEAPWTRAVVRGDLYDAIEKMAHMELTTTCERRLIDMTVTSIALFPIQD
jgi:hypothetical protein